MSERPYPKTSFSAVETPPEQEGPALGQIKRLFIDGDSNNGNRPWATRHNLQLGRRLFHMGNGLLIALCYHFFLTHEQIVTFLGLIACSVYLFEQVRISYPEIADRMRWLTQFFLRAEEQLKESAALPYAMALLLTIITFPKTIALVAILTLSIADPLSAIIGISYGRHKIAKNKSLEGSTAFFLGTFVPAIIVFITNHPDPTLIPGMIKVSFFTAFFATLMEMIPLRIDDNLTIPIFTAIIGMICVWLFGFPL